MNLNIETIRGAVARGWCSPENAHKEMDATLAEAIAQEVAATLRQQAERGDESTQDIVAKAIADVIGHGMREKCYAHADAVLAALAQTKQAERTGGEGEAVGEVADMKYNRVYFYRVTGDQNSKYEYLLPGTKLYLHPPAQQSACPRCGSTSITEAETKCTPDGDSCPGCDQPLSDKWEAQQSGVAVSRELLAIASQARNKESERARLAGEPRNETAELRATLQAVAPLLAGGVPDGMVLDRKLLRRVVDEAWQAATESEQVPSTRWADKIIDAAIAARPSQPTDAQDGAS